MSLLTKFAKKHGFHCRSSPGDVWVKGKYGTMRQEGDRLQLYLVLGEEQESSICVWISPKHLAWALGLIQPTRKPRKELRGSSAMRQLEGGCQRCLANQSTAALDATSNPSRYAAK